MIVVDVHVDSELGRATVFEHGGTVPVVYEASDPEVVERIEDSIEAILDEVR